MNFPLSLPRLPSALTFAISALLPALAAPAADPPAGRTGASRAAAARSTNGKEDGTQLRLLAVGDPPPFRQEMREGQRIQIDPPAGSLPPASITVGEEETQPVMLALDQPSRPLTLELEQLDAGTAIELRDAQEPWVRLSSPQPLGQSALALLWREPGQSWQRPQSLLVPDDGRQWPAGSLLVINLAGQPVRLTLGDRREVVPAHDLRMVPPGTIAAAAMLVEIEQSGRSRPVHSGAVELHGQERGLLVIRNADGERPRRPVTVLFRTETAPEIPSEDSPGTVPVTASRRIGGGA